ncbi:hypothetical protein O3P69_005654 [Scylla paramamosain]|uniref:Uncharacterized protein n=1 Tax=Scylla paramamosain TaxID=85552 RepID=A0AAW0U6K7_SCYPA
MKGEKRGVEQTAGSGWEQQQQQQEEEEEEEEEAKNGGAPLLSEKLFELSVAERAKPCAAGRGARRALKHPATRHLINS